ncbi:uncharacterized protein LOC110900690 [Helianthus annuus]|uniref:uncharacterized protein LOC110900690 n=1 Tax=Helianthus annuus TaxID=4232 RepID=UPI001652D8F4|nr:uncharacterized protein LOC110900690 [Helianthus annuus]
MQIQQPILCSTKATNDGCGYLSDRLARSDYENIGFKMDMYFFDSSNDFYWKLFKARSYCSQVTTIRNAASFTRFIVTKTLTKQHCSGLILISMGIVLKMVLENKLTPRRFPKIQELVFSDFFSFFFVISLIKVQISIFFGIIGLQNPYGVWF